MKRWIPLAFGLLLALQAVADERLTPMDFFFVYDRSLSMRLEGKAQDSKNWLIGSFIGPVVIPEDNVTVITFYRKAETVWDGPVKNEADKKELMRRISGLKPDGAYTDIGNALDALKAKLEASFANGRKKYIILLTDEIQEAPPGSPYFSPDGKFAHAYLTYVRREQHGSWKAITIGVGIGEKVESSMKELESVLTSLPSERLINADPRLIGPDGSGGVSDSGAGAAPRNAIERAYASSPGLVIALGALLALLLAAAIVLVARKRVQSARDERDDGDDPNDGDPRST